MRYTIFYFLCIIAIIATLSCNFSGRNKGKEEALPETITSIAESDIYDFNKVTAYSSGIIEDRKLDAKQKFLKAIDEYRNNKKPELAVPIFKESILIFPDAKAYYELGNALLDIKQYGEAVQAYHMAEQLDYQPNAKVLYNLACGYSLLENEEKALKYVQLAIENGYNNTKHMLTDADLAFARKSPRFNKVYEESMGGTGDPDEALFELFTMNFKEAKLPFTLTSDASQKIDYGNAMAYDFERFVPQMRDAQFSRDVGDEFYYLAKIKQAPNYTLLIYSGVSVWSEHPPVYHYLTSYDKKGKIISQVEFAGIFGTPDQIMEGSIGNDLTITVKIFDQQWEKDPFEHGYKNNKLLNKKESSSITYRLDNTGKITESSTLVGLKANRR
ncbi:MAG: hypothetical protein N2167_02720 [Flavobacteriales bacterium]|nr:hypothetical protein [Flavobacteriales bacterium]